jgi:hypothetical protein
MCWPSTGKSTAIGIKAAERLPRVTGFVPQGRLIVEAKACARGRIETKLRRCRLLVVYELGL